MGGGRSWLCVNGACRSPVGMRVDCERGGAHSDTWAVLGEGVWMRRQGLLSLQPCWFTGGCVCVWRAKR